MAEIANMPLNLHFQQFMKSYLSEDLYNNYQIPTRTGLDLRGKIFIKCPTLMQKLYGYLKCLLIDICAHWKCRWIMNAFNLTIFYYLTTFCTIIFSNIFLYIVCFLSLLIAFQNLLFSKKVDLVLKETNCSLHHLDFGYQEKYINVLC